MGLNLYEVMKDNLEQERERKWKGRKECSTDTQCDIDVKLLLCLIVNCVGHAS